MVGDRWVLCSDGLTDYVPEADVARLVAEAQDPRSAAASAVALALEAGTRDNVTVVVCDVVDDDEPLAGEPVFSGSAARWFAEDVETA
jgi:protein phosphatase